MALKNYGTIWVCGNCLHHHANDECGDCHSDHGHDEEPLNSIEWPFTLAMGMGSRDHNDECLIYILTDLMDQYPDMNWPCLPGDYECDCEIRNYSTATCAGCGSYLHGERHAMTLFHDPLEKN